MSKRIAIPSMGEKVNRHFGRSQFFEVYEIINGKILVIAAIMANNPKHQHEGIALLFKSHSIDVVICEWIGARAIEVLENAGLEVIRGAGGDIREIIRAYADGALIGGTEVCDRSLKYTRNIECFCNY